MRTTSTRGTAAGWVAIAVLFAATTCVESMSWTQLTAYTPLYLRELHVPAAQVPGWIAAMSSLGWILALVHVIDVRGMLLVDSALSLLMAILLTVVMRDPEHERPADLRVLSLLRGALDEIWSKPLVWRLFLATAITQVGLWTVLPYVPIYIARLAPGNAVTAVGVVLSSVGLGQAIASPLWGLAIQRLGHRAVLNATSIGAATALTAVALSHSLPVFALALVANGIFAAAILTASMAVMAATVSPERRGAVLGQILFPFYLGGVFGPPLGALAFGIGQAAVFGIAAVLSLAPLIVLLTLRPPPRAAT